VLSARTFQKHALSGFLTAAAILICDSSFSCRLSSSSVRILAKSEKLKITACGTTVVRTLETLAFESQAEAAEIRPGSGETALFIHPPYRFKAVDRMITNFHLPRTTLLMLVSAFAGYELLMEAYREAVREHYRFYSYGDAMLIL